MNPLFKMSAQQAVPQNYARHNQIASVFSGAIGGSSIGH